MARAEHFDTTAKGDSRYKSLLKKLSEGKLRTQKQVGEFLVLSEIRSFAGKKVSPNVADIESRVTTRLLNSRQHPGFKGVLDKGDARKLAERAFGDALASGLISKIR